jgi:hypothetical protein
MASLLVAIGGTGQHMALAACRLMRLGALPRMRVVVVDADIRRENGLTPLLESFGGTVKEHYTEHPAEGIRFCVPFDPIVKANPTFGDLFGGSDDREQEIFQVLFDEKTAGTKITEGFYGKPAIGVTVARKYQDRQLKPLLDESETIVGSDARIFITGSLVGGTGAGLIHDIVRSVKSKAKADVPVYGILFLRWFEMGATQSSDQTITNSTLVRNMRFGIDYLFRETYRYFRAALLLGVPDSPPGRLRASRVEPGTTKGELCHALHVVGCFGLHQLPTITRTEQPDHPFYGVALDDPHQLYNEIWEGSKTLAWYYNRAIWLREILRYAADEKRFKKEVLNSFKRFLRTDPRNVGEGLHKALARYPDVQREVVLSEMQKTWGLLADQYDFCVRWLDEVLGALPDRLQDARIRPVNSLGEIQNHWQRNPIKEQEQIPSPQEAARRFYNELVNAFQ